MTAAHSGETPGRGIRALLALLLVAATAAPAAAASTAAGEACRTRTDLVGPCFAMRGRAALHNGNPTVRIWRIGTRRVLGVSARGCMPPDCEPLPAALRAALDWEHVVFGDFILCPLTRRRPGVMQMVCVADATRLRRVAAPSH